MNEIQGEVWIIFGINAWQQDLIHVHNIKLLD